MPPSSLLGCCSCCGWGPHKLSLLPEIRSGTSRCCRGWFSWKLLPKDLPHHLGVCRPARANTQPDQPLLNAIYARDLARGREPALDDPRLKSPSGRLLFLGC
jgi:hypothetical protein